MNGAVSRESSRENHWFGTCRASFPRLWVDFGGSHFDFSRVCKFLTSFSAFLLHCFYNSSVIRGTSSSRREFEAVPVEESFKEFLKDVVL